MGWQALDWAERDSKGKTLLLIVRRISDEKSFKTLITGSYAIKLFFVTNPPGK